jgi:hypothetical protein
MTIESSSSPVMILFPKTGCKQMNFAAVSCMNFSNYGSDQQVDQDLSTCAYQFILGDHTENDGLHTEEEDNKGTLQPTWRRPHV